MIASLSNLAGPDMLVILGAALPSAALWIWMLVDCARNERGTMQIGWLLAILLGPFCTGALLYLFCRKLPRRRVETGNRVMAGTEKK